MIVVKFRVMIKKSERETEKHLERGDDDVSEKKELENGHEKLTLIRNGERRKACK